MARYERRRRQFTELARIPVPVGPPVTPSPIGLNVDSVLILDALEDGTVFRRRDPHASTVLACWRFGSQANVDIEKGSIVIADPVPELYVDELSPSVTRPGG